MIASPRRPAARGPREHGRRLGQRLGHRAVDVAAVVGLGGREEDPDLVEAVPLGERPVEAAPVGDQHAQRDPGRRVDRRQHLGGVGELGDHVGPDEARDLEPAQAGPGQGVDQRAPSRPWGSSPARSGSRRAGRPRGSGRPPAGRSRRSRRSSSRSDSTCSSSFAAQVLGLRRPGARGPGPRARGRLGGPLALDPLAPALSAGELLRASARAVRRGHDLDHILRPRARGGQHHRRLRRARLRARPAARPRRRAP